jgi:hypothetical protein
MRNVFWAFGRRKVVVVRESEDYDVLEAIAGDGGIVI